MRPGCEVGHRNEMEWEKQEATRTRSLALKKLRVRKINTSKHAVQHVATRSVVCGDGNDARLLECERPDR